MTDTLNDLMLMAEPSLQRLRIELDERWSPVSDPIIEMSRHALFPAGKLLRPLMLLECGIAVGGVREQLLPAALAIEYLHVGSLVHDDVIDEDLLRRGRPSVQAAFGVPDAIVAGDGLLLAIFATLSECAERGVPAPNVIAAMRIFVDAGLDMCRGQIMEGRQFGDLSTGLQPYLTMIGLKTGALFRGACLGGGALGGGSAHEMQALGEYADQLGLAYQMWDDLLPYLSSEQSVGKSRTSDVANRRPTFPVLIAYELGDPGQRDRLRLALSGQLDPWSSYQLLAGVMAELDVLTVAGQRATKHGADAVAALRGLPDSPEVRVLAAIAELTTARNT